MEANVQKCSYLDEYKIIKTLGAGFNAVVKLGQDPKGQLVAIKRYKSQTSDLQTLIDELSIMKNLNQQNIVKLITVLDAATYQRQNGTAYRCFAIVLEYCAGGELFDFVCDTGKFSQKVTRTYFHQMMSGLHYVHQKGYAHRDLKPQNLLLSAEFKLKIADFGFACLWRGKDGSGLLHTKLGTQGYMAPEIYAKNYQGKRTDVFAAGVIFFIMYAGCPPFEKTSESDPYFKLLKAKQFDKFWKYHQRKRPAGYFSDGFRSLFIHMTAYDPKQRPSIQQIATHPWVKQQLCTHSQIKAEFTKRKQYMQKMLEKRFAEQKLQNKLLMDEISTQAQSQNRSDKRDSPFLEIYNEQVYLKRQLAKAQFITKESLIIKEKVSFAVSMLKFNLTNIAIPLLSQDQNIVESQPVSAALQVSKIQDNNGGNINIQFSYRYGTQEEIDETLKIRLDMGLSQDKDLVVNFSKIHGNFFYYRKVLAQIRKGFVQQL